MHSPEWHWNWKRPHAEWAALLLIDDDDRVVSSAGGRRVVCVMLLWIVFEVITMVCIMIRLEFTSFESLFASATTAQSRAEIAESALQLLLSVASFLELPPQVAVAAAEAAAV